MDVIDLDLLAFIRHMPDEIYRPFRDYVYREIYDNKLKVAAIERDISTESGTTMYRKSDPEVAFVFQYSKFLQDLKDMCSRNS